MLAEKAMSSKILIVDDEAPIRTLLRSVLAAPGVAVFDADGGKQAVEIAELEGPFDVVVTDVLMPGMDGFELAGELARAGHAARFLFISGYCDAETMSKRLKAFPRAAFLNKPFAIPELLHALRLVADPDNGGPAEFRRSA
jgi:two-component system cell cycle sensor histidine kinase/response regulator CckA